MGNEQSNDNGGFSNQINASNDLSSKNELNQLYNERVVSAQAVNRDLSNFSSGGQWGRESSGFLGAIGATHSGTLVQTESGGSYLIHHGGNFAAPGHNQTVITNAENMSSQWKSVGESYNPDCNVGKMMGSTNKTDYSLGDCHNVTTSMPNSNVEAVKLFGISRDIKPRK